MLSLELPRPTERIAPADGMYAGNLAHYLGVGESALRSIVPALHAAGRTRCDRILDLPCGHGRVLRWLRAKFPDAAITAGDLDRGGVDWCAQEFGARPLYSVENIDELNLDETFDLIWCGSLLTHLDWPAWRRFLDFFARHLAPGGVLVFSTHGRLCAQWLHTGQQHHYGLAPEQAPAMVDEFRRAGFAYRDYPGQSGYGISLCTPARALALVQARPELQLLSYAEAAWDGHHDVLAAMRRREPFLADACPSL